MRSPKYSTARLRLALLLSVPLAFSLVFFLVNIFADYNDQRVVQLQMAQRATSTLSAVADDAEIGQNGLLLTGDEFYATRFEDAVRKARYAGESLNVDPDLNGHVQRLRALVRERLRTAQEVIQSFHDQGPAQAIASAKDGHAHQEMLDIRSEVDFIQQALAHRAEEAVGRTRALTRASFLIFLIGSFAMLLILLWVYNAFASHMDARDAAHLQLQKLNAELEERIEERTHELRTFNEELQQFAYVASHDLQEPLRTITSFTQLLANRYKGKLDSDADEFIDYIVNSSRRMTDLINGLLELVRLRRAGQTMEPVCLTDLVHDAEVTLQAQIRENHAVIQGDELPCLLLDRIQITQVFQNLISNAIKYRSAADPVIKISAHRDQTSWIVSVADNGRGFDQQFSERIFAIFQRLHGREVEGTGMGLSISKRIIEKHGGRMWAESKPGEGATFYFSLPASLEAKREETAASASG